MTQLKGREVRLKSRPVGMPTEANFELADVPVPNAGDKQILIRSIWMSVDPYMRARMVEIKGYFPPFELGHAIDGFAIGQVIQAGKGAHFAVGDYVSHMGGWREYALSDGFGVTKVDPSIAPVQTFLGTLGMPGLTAYAGLLKIAQPKPNDTVFVSGAAGAVGTVVCQLAKAHGHYVAGSAGSDEKCEWLLKHAKIDRAINYKKERDLNAAVHAALPKGIDIYFDNVGGKHLEAALNFMNPHGRLIECGMIDQYNATGPVAGPPNLAFLIGKRLRMEGFIVSDYFNLFPEFFQAMAPLIKQGKLKWEETVMHGLENAPKAFLGLFKGENMGKMLVKIGPDKAI